MALQTVFMAGLTLVYCLWISPRDIFDATTSNGIHDCSIVLFVIAERVPAAKKYRNAFEVIRQRVIDRISEIGVGEERSRESVPGLTADLAASGCYTIDSNFQYGNGAQFGVDDESLGQLSYILTDMAGNYEPGSLDSVTANMLPSSIPIGIGYAGHGRSDSFGNLDLTHGYLVPTTAEPSTYAEDCLDPYRPSLNSGFR